MSTNARRLGQYELQERLGQGSMAEVWKAFDIQLHRYVALKLLHAKLAEEPDFIARFEREARLIASLDHPNIVHVHDFHVTSSEADGVTAYMVMEYIEGQTLASYIASSSRQGAIPHPAVIVQFFASICLAVRYAHQHGMIHRDLKPTNILLDTRNTVNNPLGEPILTDFGVAKLLGTTAGTLTNTQFGTPLYMSPEQVNGYAGNENSDIYSLGIILYEMVTGTLPFQGDDPIAIMGQHLNVIPPSPRQFNPNIPPALEMVILRCLAKDPGARFPHALSLAAAIAEALNIPIPERLGKPAYPADTGDMPTYLAPPSSNSMPQLQASANTPVFTSIHPATPLPLTTTSSSAAPSTSASIASQQITRTPTWSRRSDRRRKGIVLGLVVLILLLIGSTLGVFLFVSRSTPATTQLVGHAFFVSSGQLNDGAQGIADTLQIDLQHVPAPATGKSYYLWLLPDKDTTPKPDLLVPAPIHPPLLLTNNLPVQNETVHYTYAGDAQHNNLLSATSRLLVTLENAQRNPGHPSSDPATWKYYAQLPQVAIPGDPKKLRGIDHLRHLYYNEDNVNVLGLYGGLDIWCFKNTEKILEWATSARDDFNTTASNYGLMHSQFIRILDYLDGIPNVYLDVSLGTPILADSTIATVSLLTVNPAQQGVAQFLQTNPPGDLDHMVLHLNQLVKAPDASPEARQLAQDIVVTLGHAKGWLQQVRTDAKKLFYMGPDQLGTANAQSLLDDLATQATYAYIGQLDPESNQVIPGILRAHYDIQKLAVFDVTTQVPASL